MARQASANLPELGSAQSGHASPVAGQIQSIERRYAETAAGKSSAPGPEEIAPDGSPAMTYLPEVIILGAIMAVSYFNAALILLR